jgi:2-iminobutanoate/2-iminopropanoate deaminase
VLEAGNATLDDVLEVGVLLTHSDDFAGMNDAYAKVFGANPPARYVARLGVVLPDVLVSIRMTAVTG